MKLKKINMSDIDIDRCYEIYKGNFIKGKNVSNKVLDKDEYIEEIKLLCKSKTSINKKLIKKGKAMTVKLDNLMEAYEDENFLSNISKEKIKELEGLKVIIKYDVLKNNYASIYDKGGPVVLIAKDELCMDVLNSYFIFYCSNVYENSLYYKFLMKVGKIK